MDNTTPLRLLQKAALTVDSHGLLLDQQRGCLPCKRYSAFWIHSVASHVYVLLANEGSKKLAVVVLHVYKQTAILNLIS